jgi:hypothetical protein
MSLKVTLFGSATLSINITRISKAALLSLAILTAAFATDAMSAGKQKPADPLTQALRGATLKQLDAEVVRQVGQAIEVGAPLRLDQRTSLPPATIDNFQPKKLEFKPETLNHRLEPGDYSIDMIGYCTKWSLHYLSRKGFAVYVSSLAGAACRSYRRAPSTRNAHGSRPTPPQCDGLAHPRWRTD